MIGRDVQQKLLVSLDFATLQPKQHISFDSIYTESKENLFPPYIILCGKIHPYRSFQTRSCCYVVFLCHCWYIIIANTANASWTYDNQYLENCQASTGIALIKAKIAILNGTYSYYLLREDTVITYTTDLNNVKKNCVSSSITLLLISQYIYIISFCWRQINHHGSVTYVVKRIYLGKNKRVFKKYIRCCVVQIESAFHWSKSYIRTHTWLTSYKVYWFVRSY